jgi:superfamily II DNA or RNA helicase/ankyrin repeat protein
MGISLHIQVARLLLAVGLDGGTLMQWAARTGKENLVQALLAVGVAVEAPTDIEAAPLHAATRHGHVEVAKVLLAAGADGGTLLHRAARAGEVDVARVLIAAGADVEISLQAAARVEQSEVIKVLLAAGADGGTLLHRAARVGEVDLVRVLIAAGADVEISLQAAAQVGQSKVVKVLLAAGADGGTLLHRAARAGEVDVVQVLLAAGVAVEAQTDIEAAPLQTATRHGHVQVAKVLLAAGADGGALLHRAARAGEVDVVRVLLAAGVDGGTLLHRAARAGEVDVARVLLASGTDDWTPWHWEKLVEHTAVKDMLRSTGARDIDWNIEWADTSIDRGDPTVVAVGFGFRTLPRLHDYQVKVMQNVQNLFVAHSTNHRGMLSMPTGSGKTRVAVQSLVEMMRDDKLTGGVLWVADREELLEQAVEAWQGVWASEGELAGTLTISRLWGGRRQPLPVGGRNVIVASIQTLYSRFSQDSRCLSDFIFDVVVMDEAHRSTAPSYTKVLENLGLGRTYQSHEPCLIGLTATPYRGFSEKETQRLRYRYGYHRLDHGAFPSRDTNEVIRYLQAEGILAKADHAIIKGGRFQLSDKELVSAKKMPWLPRSVETRIGQDASRSRRIVGAYLAKVDPDWPTLIFATSVEHSVKLAELFKSEGIAAEAVSAKTNMLVRRDVVQKFRSGDIKVLINYGIFREGFDAPKTRAVIVARPVYSPNLYFQMIGRGLRGAKNGGHPRCLVLNVHDNIANFGNALSFSELDWLWSS